LSRTLACINGVVNPLYHCIHSARDNQYKCDRGRRKNDKSTAGAYLEKEKDGPGELKYNLYFTDGLGLATYPFLVWLFFLFLFLKHYFQKGAGKRKCG